MANESSTHALSSLDVAWRKAHDPAGSGGRMLPLNPHTYVDHGIQCDLDVAVLLRDGITIYVDIYRKEGDIGVPAILSWGRSGKRAGFVGHDGGGRGVPAGTCSPSTMGEGPDPDFWCHHGYAVVNCDPAGVGNSEGDSYFSGRAEGLDCADVIEWAGEQWWCNGKVAMSGNSWYAIVQWFAAAEQPTHLAAIAPWEGCTDIYRQFFCQGGIPEINFNQRVRDRIHGHGLSEDTVETLAMYPLINEVWEDKIARLDQINIPTYMTAGWSHFHLYGSIQAFREINTDKKWIRIHRDFEWPDAYTPAHLEELLRFFDRYLKDLHNGWEMTPRVRLDVMDAGDWDAEIKRPEREFPLARTDHRKLYLRDKKGEHCLTESRPAKESSVAYDATTGSVSFDFRFGEDTEITGYLALRLYIEAVGSDDADIFVAVQKLGVDGKDRPTLVLGRPHTGAWGRLRASHRELDQERSTPSAPFHTHRREQRLSPGEIVPLDVAIWPTSRLFHKGESLRVLISGYYVREDDWFEHFGFDTRNSGTHILHFGGKYESYLVAPFIPRYAEVVADERGAGPAIPSKRSNETFKKPLARSAKARRA